MKAISALVFAAIVATFVGCGRQSTDELKLNVLRTRDHYAALLEDLEKKETRGRLPTPGEAEAEGKWIAFELGSLGFDPEKFPKSHPAHKPLSELLEDLKEAEANLLGVPQSESPDDMARFHLLVSFKRIRDSAGRAAEFLD